MPLAVSNREEAPLATLVGAPNVGKSTLFNRLVGRRRAIVTDRPGITRDRIYGSVRSGGRLFSICDTGGLLPGRTDEIAALVRKQTEEAIGESHLLIFVVDGRTGLTPLDEQLARLLRERGRPVLVAVNKMDDPGSHSTDSAEYHRLGFGSPVPISAEHGLGIADLLSRIEEMLGPLPEDAAAEREAEIRVAVVGRPNVGKSSLVNRMLRSERVTVSEIPGTTRDAVDTLIARGEKRYRIIDTAGIRRKGKTIELADKLSVIVARKSLENADVVLLVLEATSPLTAQDMTIAGYAVESHRPFAIVMNKWDLAVEPEEAASVLKKQVSARFRFARYAPLLMVSAATGLRVERLFGVIDEIDAAARIRLPTRELNQFLREGGAAGPGVSLLYMTQTGTRPPSFLIFANDASRVHFSIRRRIENRLRERFNIGPTPVVIRIRSRSRGRGAR